MQTDLSSNEPLLDIEIMGVNWDGLEAANSQATDGKSIPWLQDVDSDGDDASDAWADWGAEHLDLIVLDAHNEPLAKTSLIASSLSEPENYSALREALIDAAMESQKPWHNSENPLDIDGNGIVIPLDVLIVVNRLDSVGIEKLPAPGVPQSPRMFYDSNADGDSTPLDALLVINFLNDRSASATGEGESPPPAGALPTEEVEALTSAQARPPSATQSQGPRWLDYARASSEVTSEPVPTDSLRRAVDKNLPVVAGASSSGTAAESHSHGKIAKDTTFDGSTLREESETVLGMMR